MVDMSSMKLAKGPRREAREKAGSLEALRARLSQQVHETEAAKRRLAVLTAYMTGHMGPIVDEMAKKAQHITYQLQLKEAIIKQFTSQCLQTEAALQDSVNVDKISLFH